MGNDPKNEIDPYGLDNIYGGYSGGTYNNNVPNITLSGPVGGGPVNTQYNGGGLGDPLFLLTLEAGGPAWIVGGAVGGGGRLRLAAKLIFAAGKLSEETSHVRIRMCRHQMRPRQERRCQLRFHLTP